MIKFFNTINRKKEKFVPMNSKEVKLYTCGPTVYDFAHIGNFRAYIFEDLLRRFLEYSGYNVLHIMNITDIDDKTIKKSISDNVPLKEITNKYTEEFFRDVESLNILKAHKYPRATDYVKEMIDMILVLEKKGYTYTTDDNSVFFRISKFKSYGKLANLKPEDLRSGERVEDDEYAKEEGRDFALWKGYKDGDGDVCWDSPWGKGRPGWHIECSVMSTDYLGDHFDIHCGGVDNIFPHHENEIAQSVCAFDSKFVNYWLHNEHLLVDNQKMSKSLGNFYKVRELFDKGYSPETIRYVLISTHYRQKLNFTFEKLENAQKAINKLKELQRRLNNVSKKSEDNKNYFIKTDDFLDEFNSCLKDDLNISGALGGLFKWVSYIFSEIDSRSLSIKQSKDALNKLDLIDKVLGVLNTSSSKELPKEIKDMIFKREQARKDKNWELADLLRKKLSDMNILIEDTPEGTIWKKK